MNVVYAVFGIVFISLSSWGIQMQKNAQLSGERGAFSNAMIRGGGPGGLGGAPTSKPPPALPPPPPIPSSAPSTTIPLHRPTHAHSPSPDLPSGALNAIVASGVFLLFIAVSGCLGVKYNNKVFGRYLLGCYAALMVLVMIMEFAASITIFSFIGHLDSVAPTEALIVRRPVPPPPLSPFCAAPRAFCARPFFPRTRSRARAPRATPPAPARRRS